MDSDDTRDQYHLNPEEEEEPEGEEDEEWYWLDRLQLNSTPLVPDVALFAPAGNSKRRLDKQKFRKRLERFRTRIDPGLPHVTDDLNDFLFECALSAYDVIEAWENTVANIRSTKFRQGVAYVREKSKRFEEIRQLIKEAAGTTSPEWALDWEHRWIGSFEDHCIDIASQLNRANAYFQENSVIARLGRTQIESHVLLLTKARCRQWIKNTPFQRKLQSILAGFAYASNLVPCGGLNSDYLSIVKMRLSRAEKSKGRRYAIGIAIMQKLFTMREK